MANPEQLKILKQGVEAWNKWRKENPDIRPDLIEASLRAENLLRINFSGAYLAGADLTGGFLIGADLSGADLRQANLSWAKLTEADLSNANLSEGNLNEADLNEACLKEAKFIRSALSRANLEMANLEMTNLKDANLYCCRLVGSNLTGTILTGAKLYGTSRDGWVIKDIKCKYVYWDEEGKQRSPKDRNFRPGEFEKLYVALPFFEYVFEHGMSPLDPLVMALVVETLHERRPEWDIRIDSINARGLAPSIRFTVLHEHYREAARKEVLKQYKRRIKLMKEERDRYWGAIQRVLNEPKVVKRITAGPGSIVATDGSTINIQQHIHNAIELQKLIAQEPAESKTFAKIAKNKALDIIGKVLEDIAKGQVKEAAKQIFELGKDLGPIVARTAAYAFFKSMM